MESYNLNPETLFVDSILDIMHLCSINGDVKQAEQDFMVLEKMVNNDEFQKNIKEAESMFDLVIKNPTISVYICNLKEKLSKIYDMGRTNLASRNYA